jgi:hypothetical protein
MRKKSNSKRLVDEAMDAYVDWREECVAVWDAYARFARGTVTDAPLAFSAYRAALDREECAARAYADLVARMATTKQGVTELATLAPTTSQC